MENNVITEGKIIEETDFLISHAFSLFQFFFYSEHLLL